MLLNIAMIILIVALDQYTKGLTLEHLKPIETLPLWQNVFHLTYAENTGAAFSMLEGKRTFFIVITLLLMGGILFFLWKKKPSFLLRISLIFVAGGAIGNMIDRMIHGFVVDMLDFRLIHFAIFNVADSFVVVGGILLCYYIIFIEGKENKIGGPTP